MPKGKTAIITGSTSGIGLGIARALAGAGCNVMLNGFGEPSAIERERTQIAKEFGVRAAFNPADLAKPTEINHMVEATIGEFGQVDIVVNNAGIQHTAPVDRFPIDRWDAIIAINLSANFHTNATGDASLTSPRRMGWWPRLKNRPTSPQSTVSSG
jgi:3-hydroxybutyrate dehydrogenase